jgi:hypothetical protein
VVVRQRSTGTISHSMTARIATAATTRRSTGAAEFDGISTSAISAAATTSTATDTGRISVFQCGCSRSTKCSSSVSVGSGVIPQIVARPAGSRDAA